MKNIPDFELCKKLKKSGFPQPASKFGRFWYDCRTERLLLETVSGTAKTDGPQSFCYYAQKDDHGKSFANEASFVYAPTISEMVAQMPHGAHFTMNTSTAHNAANLCAQIWIDLTKAKNEHKAKAAHVQDNIAAVKKFDADNPEPFYRESRKIAAKHQAEQAEQRAEAFKNRFATGNNILCRLGGTKRGKIFEMFVLGQSPDQAHVKLQDEAGNAFWKEAQDVEVVNVLGNSSDNTETLTAMDATRQESNAEAILNCLKNIERLLETQKTPEMTPCKRFVAGEDLKPGECVYVSTDGAIMKS